ncbi:GrpB family protein [Thalassotalea sp. HSM 43]|uniref:GrpB family protein n=1 Tax=Thalassotalea sp. HSM 43 TaxID=2552945 RepID=UPI0010817FD9|nr:GrpB family protein [Thalassotalea sp. HSM 43]QBY04365.1 GrpB family protein [Thalassotalea sp. HSM 43]
MICAYKDEWQTDFETEKALITAQYQGDIELFHIGSTAVKGLYAKDCIDILGVVHQLADVANLAHGLTALGYRYKSAYGIEGREYFSKQQRKVHLHIFQAGDKRIANGND